MAKKAGSKKLEQYKERLKNVGKKMLRGAKGSAIEGLVGAGAYHGLAALTDNVEFVKNNWYAGGAIAIVAGHMLKRKNESIGAALCGIGGFVLEGKRVEESGTGSGDVSSSSSSSSGTTEGLDAGAWSMFGETASGSQAGDLSGSLATEASPGTDAMRGVLGMGNQAGALVDRRSEAGALVDM